MQHADLIATTLDALAQGLREGDGGNHLITFHPVGPGDSSEMLNDAKWLDFNMYQSSHAARDHDNGLYAERDWKLKPERPSLDGENRYEEIPVGFYLAGMSGLQRFDDFMSTLLNQRFDQGLFIIEILI